jgi:hypothetical protein
MLYRVLAPKEPTQEIPRGAALLEVAHGRGQVCAGRQQFGELCAKAARQGGHVAIPAGCVEIGAYEATDGELRARNVAALEAWLGRRVSRRDLEPLENRHRVRWLFMQGRYDAVLAAVVDRPGARVSELPGANGAVLRYLRAGGRVTAEGDSPKRWYATLSGRRRVSEYRHRERRLDAYQRRLDALAACRRAEDLFAFADSLREPARPALPVPSPRSLSFGELAWALLETVGRRALVTTDAAGEYFAPITTIGTIDSFGEERDCEDWLLTLEVDGSGFVQFSRRHFVHAVEDGYCGELRVRQGAGTTVVWLDID